MADGWEDDDYQGGEDAYRAGRDFDPSRSGEWRAGWRDAHEEACDRGDDDYDIR